MIDIMALRQSYERREILEIRWINGDDNLADTFTKAAPNKGLEQFVGSGRVNVRMEGWVTRKEQRKGGKRDDLADGPGVELHLQPQQLNR